MILKVNLRKLKLDIILPEIASNLDVVTLTICRFVDCSLMSLYLASFVTELQIKIQSEVFRI